MTAILFQILPCFILVAMVTCQTDDYQTDIRLKMKEEEAAGFVVGNLALETNVGMDNGFSFQIIEGNYAIDPKSVITLNQTSGEIVTVIQIDRETLCRSKATCDVTFKVTVYQGSTLFEIDVNIEIEDVNDNAPTFEKDLIELELAETNTASNLEIPLSVAIDLDTGPNNGVEGYYITSQTSVDPTQYFSLNVTKDPNGLSLRVIKALDRESIENFRFLILAKDAGSPIRTGTLTVTIDVLDENDNKPVFRDSTLNITVTEDIKNGSVIVTLYASDRDDGNNGKVIYELASQQTEDIYEHFAMNPDNGQLTVANPLDYEPGNSDKTIYVVAKDQGTPSSLSSQATIYIKILDIGNNPPSITLTYLMTLISPGVILVSEGAPLDEAVVLVNVEDSDSGINGNFSCLTYSPYFGLKEVTTTKGRKSYTVFVQHLLNRESQDQHNVTVTCTDGGREESTAAFLVSLKDENDNPPIFSTYIYRASVEENASYGTEILTVNASDADIGNNGKISYQIHNESIHEFDVDDSGIVKVIATLDREASVEKVFKVLALDHGDPARTSTATVMLTILDVNDNSPAFTKSPYRFDVTEGSVAGTDVDQVTAIDVDQGDNKRVSYYLLPQYANGGPLEVPFVVFEDGKIKTNRELDREQTSYYEFEVGARDYGNPSMNKSVVVEVKVLDINDETPYFVFPSASNNSVRVLNQVSEDPVTQVSGSDRDEGINQDLLFFIVDGNTDEIFNLDSNSGKLYIVKYRHLTEDKTYTLNLSVYDKGKPPKYSKQSLRVTLMYTNATVAGSLDSDSKSYVTIVVTVVCITVLSSVTIIIVICLLRRNDLHKCGQDRKPFNLGQNMKLSNEAGKGNPPVGTDKVYPEKGKKEVSFSLDDGDSFSSTDFKQKEKPVYINRQSHLHAMPEEADDKLSPPLSPRSSQPYITPQSNYMENPELNVSHQREDSHSETSGETATSHDSGKGGSVEGDNHDGPQLDLKFQPLALNPSTYIIKEGRYSNPYKQQNVPLQMRQVPPKPTTLPIKTPHSHSRPSATNTSYSDKLKSSLSSPVNVQNRTKNWCHSLDYNDSDYLSRGGSLSSYHGNQGHGHKHSYQEPTVSWDMGQQSVNTSSKLSPSIAFVNHGYSNNYYPSFRTNSTRDDDETTTTSGSYTINADDLDEDITRSNYSVSRVV